VYERHGSSRESVLPPCDQVALERSPTIADRVPVTEVMTRDLVCARPDLEVNVLARLMTDCHIGCVPIVDERGRPQGIVTRFDLVEQLAQDGASVTASDVMMPLALTLGEHATVAHAATMMAQEDLHHVMIVGPGGTLIGVVSSKDIVRWLVENDRNGLEEPAYVASPWCRLYD
jgi:CBS domain-containing protein